MWYNHFACVYCIRNFTYGSFERHLDIIFSNTTNYAILPTIDSADILLLHFVEQVLNIRWDAVFSDTLTIVHPAHGRDLQSGTSAVQPTLLGACSGTRARGPGPLLPAAGQATGHVPPHVPVLFCLLLDKQRATYHRMFRSSSACCWTSNGPRTTACSGPLLPAAGQATGHVPPHVPPHVPVLFCLLLDKQRATYHRMFDIVKGKMAALNLHLNPATIMSDFESGMS